jgi:hypothetical protein
MSVIDYSYNPFPLAIELFTLLRRNQTVMEGFNPVPAPDLIVATGLSISTKDLEDQVMAGKDGTGYIMTGRFLGATHTEYDFIEIGDVLQSESQLDKFGNPVEYMIDGISYNVLSSRIHMSKMVVGV